ncbi:hypothetical protein [Streptosporangium sp. NPDC049376]|uniref:hypothetical protein n=1 Tax=Streptosporangium sp. NPDC049376 TaxID=3366192 RepID=UPI0037B1E517
MDPTVLTAIVTALVGGAAGEVGKSAWTSLVTLARNRFGGDSGEVAALEAAPGGTTGQAKEITGILIDRATADPAFADELAAWAQETAKVVRQSHDVSNTIGGDATIHGTVIQAGDVFGSINLGPR